MDFNTYEKHGHLIYSKMAKNIASIIEVIVQDMPTLRVQQIQHRSKTPKSLLKKIEKSIEQNGGSLADDVERHAKDVAGCRLILYTNDDVRAFLQSYVMSDNFEIDWDRTKFHYPSGRQDATNLFISYNYVVKLKEQRISLPEYADLKDLWCEVQIQTTLDHAWSEMHHDTVYKPPVAGFGTAVLKDVEARMAKIMQDYLLPAGFDFQKVSNDVRALERGRELFETRPLERIQQDIDNNERAAILGQYRELVLPYIDDVAAEVTAIRAALRDAMTKAAATAYEPVRLGEHEYPGKTTDDVIGLCLDVIDSIRFVDEAGIQATWDFIGNAFDLSQGEEGRERTLRSVKTLSENNMHVWKRAGPLVQEKLAHLLASGAVEPKRRRIVIATAEAILDPEVKGTTSGSNTITMHQGSVIPSEDLADARSKAIAALEICLSQGDQVERRIALHALLEATRLPYNSNYGTELIKLVLTDTLRVVDIVCELALSEQPFERASIERSMMMLYRQRGDVAEEAKNDTGLVELRDALLSKLEGFGDLVNADRAFVNHKTLVGFDIVTLADWRRAKFDLGVSQAEREAAIKKLVDDATAPLSDELRSMILEVAAVRSMDGATFSSFHEFLKLLGQQKPILALGLLEHHEHELSDFLWPLLDGLAESTNADDASGIVYRWIDEGRHLRQILAHARHSRFDLPMFEACSRAVLAQDDGQASLDLVEYAGRAAIENPSIIESVLLPAIRTVDAVDGRRWIDRIWFNGKPEFIELFTEAQIDELLALAEPMETLGIHAEWWTAAIATLWPTKVLEWFGRRIDRQRQREWGERYEAVPFSFNELKGALEKHGEVVISVARSTFEEDDPGFRYTGGRLIEQVFQDPAPVEEQLSKFATGSDADRAFLVEVLAAYDGSPAIDRLCRDLIAATELDSRTWQLVELVFDANGVVSGDFGLVDAYLAKKAALKAWEADDRLPVRQFAERHGRNIDRQIAAERRRSIEEIRLRKRQYGEE